MITYSEEAAAEYALEIAKIVCANPSNRLHPNADSAKSLAEFIQTLTASLTSGEWSSLT